MGELAFLQDQDFARFNRSAMLVSMVH
jgi:hypothetical protein